MRCENDLCIYWEENACLLDNVSLNALGQCTDCICVSIDEDVLRRERERLRQRYGE